VFFTVVVTSRADGSAVTRADLRAEAFVSTGDACDTASPLGADTFVAFQEGTTGEFGTYTGVVPFDQPGQWTVRFHVFPACDDTLPDSPRGHIAFRLTVP
jgi:hypothetical protein